MQIVHRISVFAGDIKIHHTVFALPFALLSTFLAAGGMPKAGVLLLILVCMVTARTVAMAVNRLLDAKLDARNPRTARRAIPSGALSVRFYILAVCLCSATFIAATWLFQFLYHNPWPLIFSVPVLAFLSAYPLLKRFTRLCHYWLGSFMQQQRWYAHAWVAVKGNLEMPPVWMFIAVLFWTADFDASSAPARTLKWTCGTGSSRSRPNSASAKPFGWPGSHIVSANRPDQGSDYPTPRFGPIYFTGVAFALLLLVIEHSLVSEKNLSRIGLAFFTMNGILSLALGTLGIIDVFV